MTEPRRAAKKAAIEVMQVIAPLLREEEWGDAYREIYQAILAALLEHLPGRSETRTSEN